MDQTSATGYIQEKQFKTRLILSHGLCSLSSSGRLLCYKPVREAEHRGSRVWGRAKPLAQVRRGLGQDTASYGIPPVTCFILLHSFS